MHCPLPRVVYLRCSFIVIAKHQFGNYVIQSLMERGPRESRDELKGKLKEHCQEISKSQYGRHVLMQMEKYKKVQAEIQERRRAQFGGRRGGQRGGQSSIN